MMTSNEIPKLIEELLDGIVYAVSNLDPERMVSAGELAEGLLNLDGLENLEKLLLIFINDQINVIPTLEDPLLQAKSLRVMMLNRLAREGRLGKAVTHDSP